jgi:outer membrane protein OmpA-like peptidoglycan-associated protein
MNKLIIPAFTAACLMTGAVHADTVTSDQGKPGRFKEGIGMAIGGVIGGLVAGPPGAMFGIASGAWLGDREIKEDRKIANLEDSLVRKQTDLAIMEKQFADLQRSFGNEIQKVAAQNRLSSLDELANGVSLAVYFRTGSANLDEANTGRVNKLAGFLQQFSEVQLLVEGHADKRGPAEFNKHLSQTRAGVVESVLLNAGISPDRILTHSYGESGAMAAETDKEGVVFDRRVDIILTLDTRI